jgi:N-acetylmuramoyl-L-alanine amidase
MDRTGFAAGACTTMTPTSRSNGRTVYLDVGHGGADSGAVGTTTSGDTVAEKDVTLAVALEVALALRGRGDRVVLSQSTDTTVAELTPADVQDGLITPEAMHTEGLARVRCANQANADVLVSINVNSFADARVGGATTLYEPSRPFAARSSALADLLQRNVLAALAASGWSIHDRGTATDDAAGGPALTAAAASYDHLLLLGPASGDYLPEGTRMPGAVLEPLFLSNPAEATVAAGTEGQQAIAAGIATGIDQFLSG